MMPKHLLVVLSAFLVALSPSILRASPKDPPPSPGGSPPSGAQPSTEARPAPPETNTQKMRALIAANKGKIVIVNVFASWCESCRAELPDLDSLGKKHPSVVIVGIDVDEKKEDMIPFLPLVPTRIQTVWHKSGVAPLLPAFALPKDWNESMPDGWAATVPLTFVYNKKGRFETGSVGRLSPEALAAIEEIAGPQVTRSDPK